MPRKKFPGTALSNSIATISKEDKVWARGQLASSTQNVYLDYYYSGQDIYAYVRGAEDIKLPLEGLGFQIEQKKAPIFGTHSYTYDAVMRGTRLVSGSFIITTMRQNFMIDVLTAASQTKMNTIGQLESDTQWYSISEGSSQTADKDNINRYWNINPEKPTEMRDVTGGKHIFSSHPPFDLSIVYGLQMLSINDEYAQGRSFGLVGDYHGDNALHMDTNERLVDGGDFAKSKHRLTLKDIELLSCQMNYAPDGSPLNETYTFFARDYGISHVW
jgi:hypothetical protein